MVRDVNQSCDLLLVHCCQVMWDWTQMVRPPGNTYENSCGLLHVTHHLGHVAQHLARRIFVVRDARERFREHCTVYGIHKKQNSSEDQIDPEGREDCTHDAFRKRSQNFNRGVHVR